MSESGKKSDNIEVWHSPRGKVMKMSGNQSAPPKRTFHINIHISEVAVNMNEHPVSSCRLQNNTVCQWSTDNFVTKELLKSCF